jgi:hypothetical protein
MPIPKASAIGRGGSACAFWLAIFDAVGVGPGCAFIEKAQVGLRAALLEQLLEADEVEDV